MLWQISEGLDTLRAIGGALTDARLKPLQNIRIWHTVALEDPYPDPPGLEQHVPEDSPERAFSQVLASISCAKRYAVVSIFLVSEDPYPDPPGLEQYVPEDSPERACSQVLISQIKHVVGVGYCHDQGPRSGGSSCRPS